MALTCGSWVEMQSAPAKWGAHAQGRCAQLVACGNHNEFPSSLSTLRCLVRRLKVQCAVQCHYVAQQVFTINFDEHQFGSSGVTIKIDGPSQNALAIADKSECPIVIRKRFANRVACRWQSL